jgi:putative FmdB family regulatory protein
MPIYEYHCLDCGSRDERLAGLDDHTALCVRCRGMMFRQEEDLFRPYFKGGDSMGRPGASSFNLNL